MFIFLTIFRYFLEFTLATINQIITISKYVKEDRRKRQKKFLERSAKGEVLAFT